MNEIPLTIYDFGYGKNLIKTDTFYDEPALLRDKTENLVSPQLIASGQLTENLNFGSVDYNGSIRAGDVKWDKETGIISGGTGVLVYGGGIIGAANGNVTFKLDAITGDAFFAGAITASTIDIGGSDATSFHVDINANFWMGGAVFSTAPFRVSSSGEVRLLNAGASAIVLSMTNTGTGASIVAAQSNASNTNPLLDIENDGSGEALKIIQTATVSTHFNKIAQLNGHYIYTSDLTDPNGNLSGLQGDLCLYGVDGLPSYCYGGTDWRQMGDRFLAKVAGEDLLKDDAVFVAFYAGDTQVLDTAATGNVNGNFGQTSNNVRVFQSFKFPLSTQLISKMTVSLKKIGNPTDNLVLTLRSAADGTILQTIGTIAGTALTTSYADYSFTLTDFVCAKNTTYYVQIARDGSLDNTNYYNWNGGSGYANGEAGLFSSGSWTAGFVDDFKLIFKMTTVDGSVYKCRADLVNFYENFNGFVAQSVSKGATVNINASRTYTFVNSLTGVNQYLTDTPGVIGSTAGTYVRKVGVAIAAKTLQVQSLGTVDQDGPHSYASASVSSSSSTTQNIDTTFTCGFAPKLITVYFTMSAINGVGGNVFSIGISNFNGRLIGSTIWFLKDTGTTAIEQGTFSIDNSGPYAGSAMSVSLSIISITPTGFTVRASYVKSDVYTPASVTYSVTATA